MIPSNRYSPRLAAGLQEYLLEELRRAMADRAEMEKEWRFFQKQYMGEPEFKDKTFPFPGASNIVVNIAADDVDTIHARLMAMLFGPDSLWTAGPLRPDMEDFAPRLQEFLKWAQKAELNAYPVINDWLLEMCKLGTGVLKTRYVRESKKVYEFREMLDPMTGGVRNFEQQVRAMVKDSPEIAHVSLFDWYVASTVTDHTKAQWTGERIALSWPQLVNRANAGIYQNVQGLDRYQGHFMGSEWTSFMEELQGFRTTRGTMLELFEFWVDWDIDGDGEQEALVCTIHPASRTYQRLDFNPFFNQLAPYDLSCYQRVEKRLYGIGPVQMVSDYQAEVTTIHNQRIDSGAVKNSNVIVALRTGNIRADEKIFPGRILLVDSLEEVRAMPLGSTNDYSSVQDENLTLQHAARRVGVTDWISGGDSTSTNYAAATIGVQQLREGSKRFDQVLRNVRVALSGAGMKVVELYQQFSQGRKPYYVMGEKEGQMVAAVLQFPTELVRLGVMIDVTATSASYNKEVEMRANTLVFQTLQQGYQIIMQAIMTAINPQVPMQLRAIAYQGAVAGTIMMRKIIDGHGLQDVDRLVPNIQEIFGAAAAQPAPFGGGPPAFVGGTPMGSGAQGAPGMAMLGGGVGQAPGAPVQAAIGGGFGGFGSPQG